MRASPTPAIARRTMSVWRSVDAPRGDRRGERTGSSGSSRKDSSRILSWRPWAPAKVEWQYERGAGRARRGPKTEPEMKRPETSFTEEPGTLPLGGSDPTETLQGAARPRLVLGRYRLERRLGAGGFGVVWLAWDEKLEREVAVKTIPRDNGSGERVEREARAAARLNHPGIVGIYELASDAHDVYLVSELVRGRTLAELLRVGAVADRDVARIGMALCDALEHAHARGVIHRDVKPGNVMVLAEPAAGAGFAKLADFGVAHVIAGDPLTHTGDVVGTLAYMAPEQAEGTKVTPACDVYSLALSLYEAWTGKNPIRAGGPAATARRLGRPLPSLARERRDLPLELCDAIDDALDVDPARRPDPAALRAALAAAVPELDDQGGLVEPATLRRVGLAAAERRRSPWSRPAPLTRRRRAGQSSASAGEARGRPAGRSDRLRRPRDRRARAVLLGRRRGRDRRSRRDAVAAHRLDPRGRRALRLARRARRGSPGHRSDPRGGGAADPVSCSRAPGCSGRSRSWRPCSARSRSRPCSSSPRPWRRRPGGARAWPPRASSGWRSARSSPARACSSASPTACSRARPGRARSARPARTLSGRFCPAPRSLRPWSGRGSRCSCRWWSAAAGSPSTCSARRSGRPGLIAAHIALADVLAGTTALDQARGVVAGSIGAALVAVAVSQMAAPAEPWRAQPVTTG